MRNNRQPNRDAWEHCGPARRGYLLVELAAATALLGTMLLIMVPAVGWIAHERQSLDRRAVALQEAANLLDELTSLPWAAITPERVQASRMSAEAEAILSPAKLEIALDEPADDPAAKRLCVTLRWQGSHGLDDGPVRLTAWTYRRQEP